MDWVARPQNCKGLHGILQLLQGSHLNNFPLQSLKLGWVHVAFHSVAFSWNVSIYKKLVPIFSHFSNGLSCAPATWLPGRGWLYRSLCSNCILRFFKLPTGTSIVTVTHFFLSIYSALTVYQRCSIVNLISLNESSIINVLLYAVK